MGRETYLISQEEFEEREIGDKIIHPIGNTEMRVVKKEAKVISAENDVRYKIVLMR